MITTLVNVSGGNLVLDSFDKGSKILSPAERWEITQSFTEVAREYPALLVYKARGYVAVEKVEPVQAAPVQVVTPAPVPTVVQAKPVEVPVAKKAKKIKEDVPTTISTTAEISTIIRPV